MKLILKALVKKQVDVAGHTKKDGVWVKPYKKTVLVSVDEPRKKLPKEPEAEKLTPHAFGALAFKNGKRGFASFDTAFKEAYSEWTSDKIYNAYQEGFSEAKQAAKEAAQDAENKPAEKKTLKHVLVEAKRVAKHQTEKDWKPTKADIEAIVDLPEKEMHAKIKEMAARMQGGVSALTQLINDYRKERAAPNQAETVPVKVALTHEELVPVANFDSLINGGQEKITAMNKAALAGDIEKVKRLATKYGADPYSSSAKHGFQTLVKLQNKIEAQKREQAGQTKNETAKKTSGQEAKRAIIDKAQAFAKVAYAKGIQSAYEDNAFQSYIGNLNSNEETLAVNEWYKTWQAENKTFTVKPAAEKPKNNPKNAFKYGELAYKNGNENLQEDKHFQEFLTDKSSDEKYELEKEWIDGWEYAESSTKSTNDEFQEKPADESTDKDQQAPTNKADKKHAPNGFFISINGEGYYKKVDHWENDSGCDLSKVGDVSAVLEIASGHEPHEGWASHPGVEPDFVSHLLADNNKLNEKALDIIYAEFNPQEGDTKTFMGVTYILHDGRWHLLNEESSKADEKSAQDKAIPSDEKIQPIGALTQGQIDALMKDIPFKGLAPWAQDDVTKINAAALNGDTAIIQAVIDEYTKNKALTMYAAVHAKAVLEKMKTSQADEKPKVADFKKIGASGFEEGYNKPEQDMAFMEMISSLPKAEQEQAKKDWFEGAIAAPAKPYKLKTTKDELLADEDGASEEYPTYTEAQNKAEELEALGYQVSIMNAYAPFNLKVHPKTAALTEAQLVPLKGIDEDYLTPHSKEVYNAVKKAALAGDIDGVQKIVDQCAAAKESDSFAGMNAIETLKKMKDKVGTKDTPKLAPTGTKVKIKEKSYTKNEDGTWSTESFKFDSETFITAEFEVLAGYAPDYKYDKGTIIEELLEDGVFNKKQLGLVFPEAREGDIKQVGTRTYILQNGRWHRLDKGVKKPKTTKELIESVEHPFPELNDGSPYQKHTYDTIAAFKGYVLEDGLDAFKGVVTKYKKKGYINIDLNPGVENNPANKAKIYCEFDKNGNPVKPLNVEGVEEKKWKLYDFIQDLKQAASGKQPINKPIAEPVINPVDKTMGLPLDSLPDRDRYWYASKSSIAQGFFNGALKLAVEGDVNSLKALLDDVNIAFPLTTTANFVNDVYVLLTADGTFSTSKNKPTRKPVEKPVEKPAKKPVEDHEPIKNAEPAEPDYVVAPIKEGFAVIDSWKKVGGQKGSNEGGTYQDSAGIDWYCKFPKNEAIARNELLSNKFYTMMGIAVPNQKLVWKDGKLGIAGKIVPNLKKGEASELANAPNTMEGFVADAWLANWDVVGLSNDNLMLDKEGIAIRVDVGGSLLYRAQGTAKGDDFSDTVPELKTLLNAQTNPQSASVFGGISKEQLKASGDRVAKIKNDQIEAMVNLFSMGTPEEKAALTAKLIARRQDIINQLGVVDPWFNGHLDLKHLPVDVAHLPVKHDYFTMGDGGKPLSSVAAVNQANADAENDIADFFMKGDLEAMKSYAYKKIDKATGEIEGKNPISEHPSQYVQAYWSECVLALEQIAYPYHAAYDLPPIEGISIADLEEHVGFYEYGKTIANIQSENRFGFWLKLMTAAGIDSLIPKSIPITHSEIMPVAKKWYQKAHDLTVAYVKGVQYSGNYNDAFRDGKSKTSNGYSTVKMASQAYADAAELPEGGTIYKWLGLQPEMINLFLKSPKGTVLENPGSQCCTILSDGTSNFGDHRLIIRAAKGAKAMLSMGSGGYSSEQEITTLPGARFVLIGAKKGNPKNSTNLDVELLMLPPSSGYVSDLIERAKNILKSLNSSVKRMFFVV